MSLALSKRGGAAGPGVTIHERLGSMSSVLALVGASLAMVVATAAPAAADTPPPLLWAAGFGGGSEDASLAVAADESGNAYATGYFFGTADFDPGPGTFNLTAAAGDVFVSKLDGAGTLMWAKALGGPSVDLGQGVAVDGSGNVYVTGRFRETADFDPGPGTFNLTAAGSNDGFVLKLDSGGNLVWAARIGGVESDVSSALAVDGSGNVHATGSFSGTADFDPGPGTFNLTATGDREAFLLKLDNAGDLMWAGRMGGIGPDAGSAVAVGASGNVHVTGSFSGTADFDPGPGTFNLTATGDRDAFLLKLDGAGNLLWAGRTGGSGMDSGGGVAVDDSGNLHVAGTFSGIADFDPGPGVFNLTSSGDWDVFVSELDSAGNLVWAAQVGGPGADTGGGLALDGFGNLHVTGRFVGTADFDTGPSVFNVTSAGDADGFILKLDGAGNLVWAAGMGSSGWDVASGVAVDGSGHVHVTGSFSGTVDFDPGPGTSLLTSAGGEDAFLTKLGDVTAPVVTLTTPSEGAVFERGAVVWADYSCMDEAGGSGIAACVGDVANGAAITTATAGDKTFTVTGTDNAGNVKAVTHNYSVTDPDPDTAGLFDPSQGRWHLRNSAGVVTSFYFGDPGDLPFMGDWDCDGEVTPGLFRQSDAFVYLSNANRSQVADIRFFFGNPGDVPIAGDFNGDGCDTVSIYRPSEGRFFIINKLGQNEGGLGAAETDYLFGNPGDKPFVGDFDGDGADTVGLHRESTGLVYFRQTHTQGIADAQFIFGDPGDRLVAGDWGMVEGVDTPALFRPSNTTFFFRHTNTAGNADSQFVFGETSWLPVAGAFGLD